MTSSANGSGWPAAVATSRAVDVACRNESAGTVKISPIRPNGVRVMVPPYISRPSISPSTSRSGGLVVREEDVEDDARLVVHDVAP